MASAEIGEDNRKGAVKRATEKRLRHVLEQDIKRCATDNLRLADENNTHIEKITSLCTQLQQLESKVSCIPVLQKEIEDQNQLYTQAQEQHMNAKDEMVKQWNDYVVKLIKDHETQVKRLKKELGDEKKKVTNLTEEKKFLQTTLTKKDVENKKHVSSAQNALKQLEIAKKDFEAKKSHYEKEIKTLHGEKNKSDNLATERYNIIAQKEREIWQYQQHIQQMQTALDSHINAINSLEKDKKDLTLRLSKLPVPGANLTCDINIADLSDENHPTKLAEDFSELYDNEWTDACEVVDIENEREKIQFMLNILKSVSQLCHNTSRNHMDAIKSSLSTLVIRDLWRKEEEEEPEETVDSASASTQGEKPNTEKTDQQEEHLSSSKNDKGKDESVTVAKDSDISGNQTSSKTNAADGINIDNRTKDENAKYQTERKMVKMTGRSKRDSKPDVRHVAPDSNDDKSGERLYTSGNEMIKTPDANDNKNKHSQKTGSTKRCSMNGKGLYPLTLFADFEQIASEQKKIVLEIRNYFECHLSKQFYKVGSDIIEKAMGIDQHAQESVVKYIEKCMTICWSMCRHEPPVHIEFPETEGDLQYDTNIFKPYTKTGKHLDFVVWPALYLHKSGPILAKGVAQGRK